MNNPIAKKVIIVGNVSTSYKCKVRYIYVENSKRK